MKLKALLLLNNAPGSDPELSSTLTNIFPFNRVKFLQPDTTSLIQPVDQEVFQISRGCAKKKSKNNMKQYQMMMV
jgi:hypothetical protein